MGNYTIEKFGSIDPDKKKPNCGLGDTCPGYEIEWVHLNGLYVSKRILRSSISWNELNAEGLIFGKEISIDGRPFLCRVPELGTSMEAQVRRETDDGEWSRIVDATRADDDFWAWMGCWSWAQESMAPKEPAQPEHKGCFGYTSAKMWGWQPQDRKSNIIGWRPILEPIVQPSPDMVGKLVQVGFNAIEIYGYLVEFTDYDLVLEFPVPVPNMEAGAVSINNGFRWVLARDRVCYVVEKEN